MPTTQLPLLFSFREFVLGRGFIADVQMSGRALLEEGDGECWISGVFPAGFAGGGVDRAAAFSDFRRGWAEILFDIAVEAPTFEAFKAAATAFLGSSVEEQAITWQLALDVVRAKKYVDPSLAQVKAEDRPVQFAVHELTAELAAPGCNQFEIGLGAAA